MFGEFNLKITIEPNLKIVNFLDVTLDLNNHSFQPYRKPNANITYVHRQSNHPPSILRNIPIAINTRLNKISSNEHVFNVAVEPYQKALQESGYSYRLHYTHNPPQTTKKRSRHRNVIWFNPPYSSNVRTNIGQKFLQILDSCFHNRHPLRKLFNRHTVKISYSCMPNFRSILNRHNNQILNKQEQPITPRTCNCQSRPNCPLDGQCLSSSIVYQATVTRHDNQHQETYVGITEGEFKYRYNNHTATFRNESDHDTTRLSLYVWKLKKANIRHSISWKILKKCNAYNTKSKKCNLCLYEKYIILCKPELCTLNRRSEVVATCRHRKKFKLKNC